MTRHWIGVSLSLLLLLAGAAGCDDGDYCSQAESKLRGCGLIGPGAFVCEQPETRFDRCVADCALAATCSEVKNLICKDQVSGSLQSCGMDCLQYLEDDTTQCSDGSGSYDDHDRCDGYNDCDNGEDEAGCPTFTCADGTTISATGECDGWQQCADGSDEAGCPTFACADGQQTVLADHRCDGGEDCNDGSDEAGCPARAELLCD